MEIILFELLVGIEHLII